MFCINCGSKMEPNAKFCVKCGTPAAAQNEAPAAQPEIMPTQPIETQENDSHLGDSQEDDSQTDDSDEVNAQEDGSQTDEIRADEISSDEPQASEIQSNEPQTYTQQPFQQPQPPFQQQPFQQPNEQLLHEVPAKKAKLWIPIVIVVGVVAILIAAVIILLVSVFGSDAEEPTLPTEPPPIADAPDIPPEPTEPPTGPVVEPPPLMDLPDIPGIGGEISVEEATVFHFIPDVSGMWIFTTSDNVGDPMLEIFDENGHTVAADDDSAGFLNSRISVELDAGHRYTINARFFSETGVGSYLLTVELESDQAEDERTADPVENTDGLIMDSFGGNLEITESTYVTFIPAESGLWQVSTLATDGDPFLQILDSAGTLLDQDDDFKGDFNAWLAFPFEAGVEYTIRADFFARGTGHYTLFVRPILSMDEPFDVQITGPHIIQFTPSQSGSFEFFTSDSTRHDPFITVFDSFDFDYLDTIEPFAYDDDGGDGFEASVIANLQAGTTYYIAVFFWGFEVGTTTLNVVLN